jgi:hypothetical protein
MEGGESFLEESENMFLEEGGCVLLLVLDQLTITSLSLYML